MSAWFVFTAPPLTEQKAAEALRRQGINVAVPMRWQRGRQGKNRAIVLRQNVAAPGYVFVSLERSIEVHSVLSARYLDGTHCVRRVVRCGGVTSGIHDHVMQEFIRNAAAFMTSVSKPLPRVGDVVRVKNGPLAAAHARVANVNGAKANIITELFRRSLATVAVDSLEVVSATSERALTNERRPAAAG